MILELKTNFGLLLLVAAFTGSACGNHFSDRVPDIHINGTSKDFVEYNNTLSYQNKPFSGYIYRMFDNGDTIFSCSYLDGKQEGRSVIWFKNGKLSEERWYHNGRKTGSHRQWYLDGHKRFEAQMVDDHYEGYMKTWFDNGQLYQYFDYKDGHEDGMERMWKEDGTVIANYQSINGRKYGLTGVKGCQSLWTDRVH